MSSHVVGFRPPDKKWEEMKLVWEACERTGVEIPKKVLEFFDHEDPAGKPGMSMNLMDTDAVKEYHEEAVQGFEVDLTKLPKDLEIIRFYNSW